MQFDPNPVKDKINQRRHGVSFAEAEVAFFDPHGFSGPDPYHSDDELRFIRVGLSDRRLLLVIFTYRNEDSIRIISARKAPPRFRRAYEQEKDRETD